MRFARSGRTGLWETAGVPDDTLRAFSKRGADIQALLWDLGFDRGEASRAVQRVAESRTRQGKTEVTAAPDATLRGVWQAEARQRGWDPDRIARQVLGRGGPDPTAAGSDPDPDPVGGNPAPAASAAQPGNTVPGGVPSVAVLARQLADPETGLTASTRRFTRVEAIAALADALPAGAGSVAEIEALTDAVLAQPGFVPLPSRETSRGTAGARHQLGAGHMSNAQRYTTVDVLAAEQTILDAAAGSDVGQHPARVSPELADLAADVVYHQPRQVEATRARSAQTGAPGDSDAASSRPVPGRDRAAGGEPARIRTDLVKAG